jgi:phage tail-like protein
MPEQYPLPAFHFTMEWGGQRAGFTEISGLNQELQVIEYREGASPEFAALKQPGMPKNSDIACKRGIIASDNEFYDWLSTVKMNKIERRDLVVSLLNEEHEPVMVWKVQSAFPIKIEGPALKSTGNEVAIESITLAHGWILVQND